MSNAVAEETEVLELTMEREIAYPPEIVFAAWTKDEALRQWMGPGEITAPDSTMDARVGGALTIPMVHPDGTVTTARGEITEFVQDRKLRFTWAWDQDDGSPGQLMEITLEFFPVDSGTRFVLHQTNFIDAEARDKHEHGWDGCLVKLKGCLSR